jgi:Ras GTPase-activating-like protein IQGAP2/3
MLIAKIIQNLANNVSFGKEGYLVSLNPFLEKNVRTVLMYLTEAQVRRGFL